MEMQAIMNFAVSAPRTNQEYTLPKGLLLHVGCGPITPDGWVNLDASWNLLAARIPGLRTALRSLGLISANAASSTWSDKIQYCNVNNGLPFGDGEAAVVYASHVLEHLGRRQSQAFVKEAYRVLKPGGVIRLVVPDLERLARFYLQGKSNGAANGLRPADEFMMRMMTCTDYGDSLPVKLYRTYLDTLSHKWMYDCDSLQNLLSEAGFHDLAHCGYLESRIPKVGDVERENRFDDGVCVEGVR
jgi:predicted SAM-dependent methyltransferase